MAANRKLLAVAVVCAAAVVGVTGCSSDSGDKDPFEGMSADKIAKKAVDASKGAGSFRMTGDGKQDGDPMKAQLAIAKGGNCTGKTEFGKGGTAELLIADKTMYIKADKTYWQQGPGDSKLADRAKGRWVKTPSTQNEMCNPDKLFETKKLKGAKRAEDSEVDGKKAAVLTKKDGKKTREYYIAMEGKPYFLQVVTKGEEGGTAKFSDYGKPIVVKAPAPGEVADLQKIMGS
ncbi:hypothetical protein ACQB60_37185 [Actinomycetota bacterium Odt1-20B]